MSQTQHKRSFRGRRALVAAVFASLAAVAIAEDVVVKHTVNVKGGKTTFSPTVATVTADTKLAVVKREGSYIRVKTPDGVEGYITRDDLPAGPKAGMVGGGDISSAAAGGSGRGMFPDSKQYAVSKHQDPAVVDNLMALCNSVTEKQLFDFAAAEHLGPKEYRK